MVQNLKLIDYNNYIMKTTIDLTQFDFDSRIFNQISDCPDTGFIRVLILSLIHI